MVDRLTDVHDLLHTETTADWARDNVWKPMVNGSGVLQVYNTFAPAPVELPTVPRAETGSREWMVHLLAEVGGAILPYLAAGKLTGYGLKGLGGRFGATGFTSKVLENEAVAMVCGAGIYDFTKAPRQGETRIGNALGSMATFATFESGNALLKRGTARIDNAVLRAATTGVGRFGVGAAGGLAGLETSNYVSALAGQENKISTEQYWDSFASGGFLNVALPMVHKGICKLVDPGIKVQVADGPERRVLQSDTPIVQNSLAAEGAKLPNLVIETNSAATSATDAAGKTAEVPVRDQTLTRADGQGKLVPIDRATLGVAEPLGATVSAEGINFAITSKGATQIDLLLFPDVQAKEPSQVLPMFKTGDVWHRFVPELPDGSLYLYRAHGPYQPTVDGTRFNPAKAILDPYSKAITGDTILHYDDKHALGYDNTNPADPNRHHRPSAIDNVGDMPKSVAVKLGQFDWQGDKPPATPIEKSVIYEVNLRGFTAEADGMTQPLKGTYRGMIEKIPYLKELGVTAVELLPVMEFDKADWPYMDPETGKPLGNDWGYNTVGYQAPKAGLAHDGTRGQQINEFKTLVRELHKANIEVYLDIVFNHTREGDHLGPTVSFRGLDNNVYYLLTPGKPDLYVNHSGCGNTMSCNHPVVQKLILDTLRYWTSEMHVDGFRFDLASIFNYDVNGVEKAKTPIIEAIQTDPVLQNVKLIAEAWSPANYRLGKFSDQRWGEWNGDFRDVARKFVKGDEGQVGVLADRIAGSPGWFDPSKGRYSVNFITAHDGFTMRDLVSFNEKHNLRNGEGGRDGSNDNFSWNCGYEGSLDHAQLTAEQKAVIEQLRDQQTKNLLTILFMSRGLPMLLYGDEVRRSQQGNNNTWPVAELNNFDWKKLPDNMDMHRFTRMLIELRQRQQIGSTDLSLLQWHGTDPAKPDFGQHTRFLAWQYGAQGGRPPVYTALNAYWQPLTVKLPAGKWRMLVDTGRPSGLDVVSPDHAQPVPDTITIQPRTSVVLEGNK